MKLKPNAWHAFGSLCNEGVLICKELWSCDAQQNLVDLSINAMAFCTYYGEKLNQINIYYVLEDSQIEEDDIPTDMDDLLRWCLLSFLKLEAKNTELPLKTNLLYRWVITYSYLFI